MAKMTTPVAAIKAALANNTARQFDDGNTILHDDVLYVRQRGAVPFKRMPAQKENRRRLGIVLHKPAPPANVAPPAPNGVKVIVGPAAVRYGKVAHTNDYIRFAQRMGIIPADRKPVLG